MNVDDPNLLLAFDGKLAYVGVTKSGRFYVESADFSDALLCELDNLADALMVAAKECGAV